MLSCSFSNNFSVPCGLGMFRQGGGGLPPRPPPPLPWTPPLPPPPPPVVPAGGRVPPVVRCGGPRACPTNTPAVPHVPMSLVWGQRVICRGFPLIVARLQRFVKIQFQSKLRKGTSSQTGWSARFRIDQAKGSGGPSLRWDHSLVTNEHAAAAVRCSSVASPRGV